MKLSKIDLSHLIAIAHEDDRLNLVIDRGDSLEIVEIPAPEAAYEGLQLLDAIVSDDSVSAAADFYQLPGVQTEIAMQSVESTMANSLGYNADLGVLQIEFKNGSVYQYEAIAEETWHELQVSQSPGQFFNQKIRGNYHSQRIH